MILSPEIQMALYALLVVAAAFAGYYVGKKYDYEMIGAGVGAAAGLIVSFAMYRMMGMKESMHMPMRSSAY